MEQKRWFVLLDSQVTGPYDHHEVENRIDKAKEPLIWGRGQGEWLPPDKWRSALQVVLAQGALQDQKDRLWKMKVNDKELTPMKMEELIEHLKDYSDLSPVRIWTEGFDDWKEVFQVQKVMEELGISRRKHPRVPIMGSLKCDTPRGETQVKVISISEGGLGVNGAKGFQLGEKFMCTLTSPNLYSTVNSTMEVVYVGGDGYAGMRFIGLPSEGRSTVIEYIKKFQQPQK